MGTSGSGSTADVSDEITADTLGIVSGKKIVTATSKDTSVAKVTDVVTENADVSADIGSPVRGGAAVASTNASAGTYIKSFKITAVGAGSTYIDVKITDTATSTESHKYIPVEVSSAKKLKSKTAAEIKIEVTDKNPEKSPQKTEASINFPCVTVDKTTADSKFTIEFINTGNGDVTYTSSNTAVAEVAEKTGLVTIVGAGTATITATVADSDTYTYATKTASYTLTVTQAGTSTGTSGTGTSTGSGTSTGTGTSTSSGSSSSTGSATAAIIDIGWSKNDITGSGNSFTKNDVTITTGNNIDFENKNFFGGGTFTTTLGNFTRIEVATGATCSVSGEGWSGSTWTGNASSVSFSGDIESYGYINFIFTIEPTN